ncbi:MAG: hypothetical protein ACK448_04420 [Bacteroidota bacterium]
MKLQLLDGSDGSANLQLQLCHINQSLIDLVSFNYNEKGHKS